MTSPFRLNTGLPINFPGMGASTQTLNIFPRASSRPLKYRSVLDQGFFITTSSPTDASFFARETPGMDSSFEFKTIFTIPFFLFSPSAPFTEKVFPDGVLTRAECEPTKRDEALRISPLSEITNPPACLIIVPLPS